MARRISRTLKLALSVLVLLAPLAAGAAEPNIVVLRVTSADAMVSDLERLAATMGMPMDGDEAIDGAMGQLQFPGLALIDRSRPAALVFSSQGLALGVRALAGVLPVSDVDAALLVLEDEYETHGVNESTHTFSRSDGNALVVRVEDDYLAVGLDPGVVGGLDLAAALDGAGLPPGNITLEIFLEEVAPIVQAGLLQGRQMIQAQMETKAAEAEEEEAEEPEEAETDEEGGEMPDEEGEEAESDVEVTVEPELDPQAIAPVLDLYFDFLNDAVNNVSRVQYAIEVTGEHLLFHQWVSPRAGSTLAGLVEVQSGGFPELARLVDPEGAMIAMAGQVTRTPAVNEAVNGYMGRYLEAIEGLMAGLPDQEVVEQFGAVMGAAQPLIEQSLECYRGDVAATVAVGPESGLRMTQVMGVADGEACRDVLAGTVELLDSIPEDEDGELFLTMTENALSHAGVEASRYEMQFMLPLVQEAEGEEAAELLRLLFGGDRLVAYQGMTDEYIINASGAEAEQAFTETVDRIAGGAGGGGLNAAYFAPLSPGPGFFAALDLSALFGMVGELADDDEEREAIELLAGSPGRIVYGARFSGTGLEFDLAFPMETLASWGQAIAEAKAAEEHECEEGEEEPDHHEGHEQELPEISDDTEG